MKKNDWKYLINGLMFVDICSIAMIGLIMAFVVPPARGPDTSKVFLGLHRHQWGDFHLYLSLFLLALLVCTSGSIGPGFSAVPRAISAKAGRRSCGDCVVPGLGCCWWDGF